MKIFVTGVGGQLGHDVMNELNSRGYEGTGSDIQPVYSGVQDGTYVCTADYRQMDITDKDSVKKDNPLHHIDVRGSLISHLIYILPENATCGSS